MEFRILGQVEARRDGVRLPLSGLKVHTVLAALLLARGKVVSDDQLSRLLWGWQPPATRNAQLYTYVSRLRKHLGEDVDIVRRHPGYAVETAGHRVDAVEFERLDRIGRQALEERRFERAGTLLRNALELWRGPVLANVTGHLAEAEIPHWEEARVAVLENRVEADLALGRHQRITAELMALVAEFPLRERMRAQLMTALYRSGRQAEALRVYHEGRQVLADELGVDPGAELVSTYRAVLNGALDLPVTATPGRPAASSGPAGGTAAARTPAMLPPDTIGFTGRDRELADLCARLAPGGGSGQPRRFLLTGMAGTGKTALAVRAAHASARHFPDGQLHADLCHSDGRPKDPREVLAKLLRALGPDVPDTDELDELVRLYRTRTAGRQLLIVLDNSTGDRHLAPLLPGSPESAVIVTGRPRLATTAGAHTTVVEPLADTESLALLSAVAGASRIAAEPEAALRITAHCAGLPLALRIAGARLASRPYWSVARLAQRLDHPVTRLQALRFGDLDVRRTLGDWLRRLDMDGRDLLSRCAELGGHPFPASAAAELTGLRTARAEELLEQLADSSAVELSGVDTTGTPQYRIHPLVALFATASPVRAPVGAYAQAS